MARTSSRHWQRAASVPVQRHGASASLSARLQAHGPRRQWIRNRAQAARGQLTSKGPPAGRGPPPGPSEKRPRRHRDGASVRLGKRVPGRGRFDCRGSLPVSQSPLVAGVGPATLHSQAPSPGSEWLNQSRRLARLRVRRRAPAGACAGRGRSTLTGRLSTPTPGPCQRALAARGPLSRRRACQAQTRPDSDVNFKFNFTGSEAARPKPGGAMRAGPWPLPVSATRRQGGWQCHSTCRLATLRHWQARQAGNPPHRR